MILEREARLIKTGEIVTIFFTHTIHNNKKICVCACKNCTFYITILLSNGCYIRVNYPPPKVFMCTTSSLQVTI